MGHIMENIIMVEGSRKELDEFIEKHYREDGRIDFSTFKSDYAYLNQIYDVELISEFRFAHLQELYFTPKQRPSMISIYYIGNREGPGLFYSLLDMYPISNSIIMPILMRLRILGGLTVTAKSITSLRDGQVLRISVMNSALNIWMMMRNTGEKKLYNSSVWMEIPYI